MSTTTIPAATCEVADRVEPSPQVTKLCMFQPEQSLDAQISRTAAYVKDPKDYLTSILGADALESRSSLLCIPSTPIDKDVYGRGEAKGQFETHVAKLLGKQHGLFFQTGVQAQLAACKIHCQRAKQSITAWHISSHLESAEEAAYKELYSLSRQLLGRNKDALPSVAEIKEVLALPMEQRPAVIVVEIPNRTLGCETYEFTELEEISAACKEADVKFHMDGARIWEIEPYYVATAGKTFADLGKLFDSVYVSFYKGLGGATGAMLLHNDEDFVNEARVWQRRAGGNAYSMSYYWADCQRGFNETIGTFGEKREKMLGVANGIIEATKDFKAEDGTPIVRFRPQPPNCCQTHTIFHGFTGKQLEAARDKVQDAMGVRVFERLRPKISVDEMMAKERTEKSSSYLATEKKEVNEAEAEDKTHFMEWSVMSITEKIETKVFVDAYVSLCKALLENKI